MEIVSWNVNGIRSVMKKNFMEFVKQEHPDILCLQETKAHPDQLDVKLATMSYKHHYWSSAKKKGYSGTAIFTKIEPLSVKYGIGMPEFDDEGRFVIAEFKDFILLNVYFPNSGRGLERVAYKVAFCNALKQYLDKLVKQGKNVIVTGDYNIAHTEIDLKNPKTNQNTAGFLPIERDWMTRFLNAGYIDSFRHLHPNEPGHYTYWTYMFNARSRNVGWRIDYFCVSKDFLKKVKKADILPDVMGSDHCPIRLVL